MSVLHNGLLCLYQIFSIFLGHTYNFIDFKKRMVKYYLILKFYVYLVNLIYTFSIIKFVYDLIHDSEDDMITSTITLLQITRLGILLGLIIIRVKEEKFFKHVYDSYETYFQKYIFSAKNDKTTEKLEIFFILLILFCAIYYIFKVIHCILYRRTLANINSNAIDIFTIIEIFIMFHHNIILSYIAKGFRQLNNHLRTEQETETFPSDYLKLTLILERVNSLNGPLIFCVLLAHLINISVNLRSMFQFVPLIHSLPLEYLIQLYMSFAVPFNIIFYFLLCDRLDRTTKETQNILMEYCAKPKNPEVFKTFKNNFWCKITNHNPFLFID